MPQLAIAAAAAGIATSATVIGALGTFGATLAAGAFTITANTLMAKRAARKAKAAYNASLKDRTQVVRSAIVPRNIILGQDRTSGPLACWFTWGDKRQYHTFAVVLAGHQCHAVPTYYFNDDALTLDGDGWVTAPAKYTRTVAATHAESFAGGTAGTVLTLSEAPASIVSVIATTGDGSSENPGEQTEEAYTWTSGTSLTVTGDTTGKTLIVNYSTSSTGALFKIKTYLGAPGQTAAPELIAAAAAAGEPDSWTVNHKGTNVCYCTVQMEADFDVLGEIGAPNVSAVVQGAVCYDPRTTTWGWSQNPTLQSLWYLYSSGYAPTTALAEINADELIASANVCDESVDFSASVTAARYAANGRVSTDMNPMDILGHIVDAMDGDAVWVGGQWVIAAGYHRAPSLAITEATLSSSPITIRPAPPKRDLFNAVTGQYVDPSKGYVRTSYPLVTSSTYQTQDGGEVLQSDMSFELVADPLRCQMIAWQRLARARQGLTITLGTTLGAYDTFPTRTLTLQAAEFGITTAQTFVVESRTLAGPVLEYQLQETGAAVWEWDYADASAPVDLPGVSLPDASDIEQVEILSVESGAGWVITNSDGSILSRIAVTWAPITQSSVTQGGKVEIQLRTDLADADAWITVAIVPGDSVQYVSGPVPPGGYGLIRARAITANGRNGPWSDVVSHLVSGDAQVPENYDTFTVTFLADGTRVFTFAYTTTPAPADLAGAMFRWKASPTGTETWDDLFELNSGPVIDSPREIRAGDPGAYRFACRAITRSGVLCDVADTLYTNVTLPELLSGTPMLQLLADGNTMSFTSAGAAYPAAQSIEFTAVLTNVTGTPMWYAEAFNELGVSQGAVSLTGSGLTRTMSSAQFLADPDTQFVTVWVELDSLIAVQRVVKLTDGGEPIITLLQPQERVLPASPEGVVSDWTNATSQFWVTVGQTPVTSGVTYTLAPSGNPSGLAYTLGATTGAIAITGAGSWANTSDETTITFRATHDATGAYRDLALKLVKARTGVAAISYEFSNASHTVPADVSGSVTSYAGSGTTIKVSEGGTALTYHTTLAAGRFTIGTPTVSPAASITVGAISGSGTSTATVAVHSLMSAAQDVASITYPVTARRANGTDYSFNLVQTITKSKTGSTGAAGSNNATVSLYQRTASSSAPALPSGTMTYTFATAALTGGTPGSWTTTIPASGGAYLWITQAVASANTTTDTIAAAEWSAARLLSTDGTNGTNGAAGTRGSRTLYDTSVSYTASYNNGAGAGAASYKAQATSLIATATSGTTPTTPIKGDTVTFSNGSNYVVTYTNDGTYGANGNNSWTSQTTVLDGSLLVPGTVAASALTAGTITSLGGAGDMYLGQSDMLAQFVRPNTGAVKTVPVVYIYDQYASASTGPALQVASNYGKVIYGVVTSTNATDRPFEFVDGFVLTTGEFLTARSYRTAIYALNSFYSTGAKLATPSYGADITGGIRVSGTFGVNGSTPQGKYSLPAAATDAATTQALANAIRTALINCGIAV